MARGKSYIDLLLQWAAFTNPKGTLELEWHSHILSLFGQIVFPYWSVIDMTHHGDGCDVELNSSLQLRQSAEGLKIGYQQHSQELG